MQDAGRWPWFVGGDFNIIRSDDEKVVVFFGPLVLNWNLIMPSKIVLCWSFLGRVKACRGVMVDWEVGGFGGGWIVYW